MKDNPIRDKTFEFSLEIIQFYKHLTQIDKEFIISKQLLRSATSIGANIVESNDAISKKEFLMKIYISLKESSETIYWLELLKKSQITNYSNMETLIDKANHIRAILRNISKTTKLNMER